MPEARTYRGSCHCGAVSYEAPNIAHLFGRTCGVEPFARGKAPDGAEAVALNLRCLEGLDLDSLTPMKVDGRSR